MKTRMLAVIVGLTIGSMAFAADNKASKKNSYRLSQIAHLSCVQAWVEADKSVDKAFSMIETMTVYLLKQRGQAFPDSQEAGQRFGQSIDSRCRSDPDQLMLTAVDVSLRELIK